MLVDSHAHLEGETFDADREQVIARAREAGVQSILAIGNADRPGGFACAIQLAEKYDFLYATVGIHPHEAKISTGPLLHELAQLARSPKVIAWGEIGLDYHYEHSSRDVQQRAFVEQMELALAVKLPIIIHCRPSANGEDAWEDCFRLLEEHWTSGGLGGILHCFTGTWDHAQRALDMGFLISFSGNITFPKAQSIRDVCRQVPLDRMLIETDCPFLAPVPNRGKRNEPAFVAAVAAKIAEVRGLALEEVASRTTRNFSRFFSLHEKPNSI